MCSIPDFMGFTVDAKILVGRPTLMVLPSFLVGGLPLATHGLTGFGLGKLTSLGLAPMACAFSIYSSLSKFLEKYLVTTLSVSTQKLDSHLVGTICNSITHSSLCVSGLLIDSPSWFLGKYFK